MMYLWPQTSSMKVFSRHYGVMTRASDSCIPNGIKEGRSWAMDNEAFTRGFNFSRWYKHFNRLMPWFNNCLFVVVPDIVGDYKKTLSLWHEYYSVFDRISAGKLAFVVQDGQTPQDLPQNYNTLFIGGSTNFKLSSQADNLIEYAKNTKKKVHAGRVNSKKRIDHFKLYGVDTVDGTGACFAPKQHKRIYDMSLNQPPLITLI